MKYYIQDKLEELTEIAKNNPAVTVDFNHPSLVLFERISTEDHKSVISLNAGIGPAAVVEFWNRLDDLLSYTIIGNDFGDTCYPSEIQKIVRKSHAMVRDVDGVYSIIGPISALIKAAKEPAEVMPAQPIPDAV